MKECSRCKQLKDNSEYCPEKRTSTGLYSACRACIRASGKKYPSYIGTARAEMMKSPTPKCVSIVMYSYISVRLHDRDKSYIGIKCFFSRKELEMFLTNHWDGYLKLYNAWRDNDYERRYVPSIDRMDSSAHYTLDNIRIIPFHENASRANLGHKQTPEHIEKRSKALIEFNSKRKLNQNAPHK